MNPEKQRIAIAEACGWRKCIFRDRYGTAFGSPPGEALTYREELPDYPNDLNAMHEAEKIFSGNMRIRYFYELSNTGGNSPIQATAAQRAEAFLKTIGKWGNE